MEDLIRKHTLKNILDFGKANQNSILGKVIGENPKLKSKIKEVISKIRECISEVESLSRDEMQKELENYNFKKVDRTRKKLIDFQGAVTRFAPEPSGYLHIGHAKAVFLNRRVADENSGHMVLRIDDTNPKNEKQEYVDSLKDDLKWLGVKYEKESYASDYMDLFYDMGKRLLDNGHIYICTCDHESIKSNRKNMVECDCRSGKNNLLWETAIDGGLKEGSATARMKINMSHQNPVMRDPSVFRIIDAKHFRHGNKYSFWPSYDFAAPILDSIEGITHAMRTKEYELRRDLYFYILELLKLRKPNLIEYARLSVSGTITSKRKIAKLVREGKVSGWDDPRLATLKALKRRGISPKAIRTFVLRGGLGKAESVSDIGMLYKENRKIFDKTAVRLFFIKSPVLIDVVGAPESFGENPKHPINNLGMRRYKVDGKVWIERSSFEKLKSGKTLRLKGLYNIEYMEGKVVYSGSSLDKSIERVGWCPEGSFRASILVPGKICEREGVVSVDDNTLVKGVVEPEAWNYEEGSIFQAEGVGFIVLDKKSGGHLSFLLSC